MYVQMWVVFIKYKIIRLSRFHTWNKPNEGSKAFFTTFFFGEYHSYTSLGFDFFFLFEPTTNLQNAVWGHFWGFCFLTACSEKKAEFLDIKAISNSVGNLETWKKKCPSELIAACKIAVDWMNFSVALTKWCAITKWKMTTWASNLNIFFSRRDYFFFCQSNICILFPFLTSWKSF